MKFRFILIFTTALAFTSMAEQTRSSSYKRVCYYTNWSQYRHGNGRFTPDNIDAHVCTHIVYAFASMNRSQLIPIEWNDEDSEWSRGMYSKVTSLKMVNPDLKVILSVGGWAFGVKLFSEMVSTQTNRAHFISTTIQYLRDRNFDGLDLNWEFPAAFGSLPVDRQRFTLLLKELRQEFDEEHDANRDKLILSAAVSANENIVRKGYQIGEISKYLDWLGVMCYDLHGSWEQQTGHHSALYASPNQDQTLTVSYAAGIWTRGGVPRNKLLIGIATYGRTFTLSSIIPSIGAPAVGPGSAAGYTNIEGIMSYYEICDMLQSGGFVVRDNRLQSPYAYYENQWVGYDDPESIVTKMQWIKDNNFGGVIVWAMDFDDFSNKHCNQGPNPILNTIKRHLDYNINESTDTAITQDITEQPELIATLTFHPEGPEDNKTYTNSIDPSTDRSIQTDTLTQDLNDEESTDDKTTENFHSAKFVTQYAAYQTNGEIHPTITTGKLEDSLILPTDQQSLKRDSHTTESLGHGTQTLVTDQPSPVTDNNKTESSVDINISYVLTVNGTQRLSTEMSSTDTLFTLTQKTKMPSLTTEQVFTNPRADEQQNTDKQESNTRIEEPQTARQTSNPRLEEPQTEKQTSNPGVVDLQTADQTSNPTVVDQTADQTSNPGVGDQQTTDQISNPVVED